ncbi:MAG: 4Fe-4S binding protein, partial [Thermoplasmata archaeon]
MARIAILLEDHCHPKECQWECAEYCPVNRMEQECIIEGPLGKPIISETLCIGCGICIHKCPFDAIKILNTPEADESEIVHRYGYNGFRLYRLPTPPPLGITGLIGRNGIGKSTAVRILGGAEVPNLGDYEHPGSWERAAEYFRGTALHAHLERIRRGELRVASKPQYVDVLSESASTVGEHVRTGGPHANAAIAGLELRAIEDRRLSEISGGELQLAA